LFIIIIFFVIAMKACYREGLFYWLTNPIPFSGIAIRFVTMLRVGKLKASTKLQHSCKILAEHLENSCIHNCCKFPINDAMTVNTYVWVFSLKSILPTLSNAKPLAYTTVINFSLIIQ
jgi:hypothetical protein